MKVTLEMAAYNSAGIRRVTVDADSAVSAIWAAERACPGWVWAPSRTPYPRTKQNMAEWQRKYDAARAELRRRLGGK